MKYIKQFEAFDKEHPDWKKIKNSFDLSLDDPAYFDLLPNLGRWIMFKPSDENGTLKNFLPHKITSLQKIFNGSAAYRVQNQINIFGTPLRPENILKFLSEEEAEKIWNENYMKIFEEDDVKYEEFVPFDKNFDD